MKLIGKTTYCDGYRNRTANIGKCDCGTEFPLICLPPLYACDCPGCGQYYNATGQRLKDPSEWEEDLEEDY